MAVSSLDFLHLMLVMHLKLKEPTAWTQDEQDFLSTPVLNQWKALHKNMAC